MSENTIPQEVSEFLKTHPAVIDYELVPDKVKWIKVRVNNNRDLINFPTEYAGYRLEAAVPEIEEESDELDQALVIKDREPEPFGGQVTIPPYTEKTDDDLRQLAMDIADDKVFTDRHISKADDEAILGSIFMPLLFMSPDQAKTVFTSCGIMYEYYAMAGPRKINGYPTFMSFQYLTFDDTLKIAPLIKACMDFKKQFLGKKTIENEQSKQLFGRAEYGEAKDIDTDTGREPDSDVLSLQEVPGEETEESEPKGLVTA